MLAVNQRLMDVADNTDMLLHAYAGEEEQRPEKKNLMFYQRPHEVVPVDEGEKAAALRILNLSRPTKKPKK